MYASFQIIEELLLTQTTPFHLAPEKLSTTIKKKYLVHECATNLPAIASINRTESYSENLPKLEFKYSEI